MFNSDLMTENATKERMGVAMCQLEITKDLANKPEYNNNSWFVFGKYEVEPNHKINFLFHIMGMKLPVLGLMYQSIVTFFDEQTKSYYAKDYLFRHSKAEVHDRDFYLKMPNGTMSGDWNKMCVTVSEGDFRIDIVTKAVHYPILIGGNSVIDMCNMCIHEYSVPCMETKGTMTVEGKTYSLDDKGYTWFDRQWQNINYMHSTMKWTWISITLDSGEIFSIFDTDLPGWEDNILAILLPDGTQINKRRFNPAFYWQKEYWKSEKSKQRYPVKWQVSIPEAELNVSVVPIMKEQEIVSVLGELNKYEGCCKVTGNYRGKAVTGSALVELIGHWKNSN